MDGPQTGSGSGGGGGGGGHRLIGSRIEEHRKYMSESSCCPRCGHKIDRKLDWVGLPAGVKFDPTDQELIEHLEAKVRSCSAAAPSHPLIDEFISTIEGEDGICYTHPEKLPGLTKDGLSRHFFHRPSKAYTTGTRKRRKIQPPAADASSAAAPAATRQPHHHHQQQQPQRSETRWHKTGKTRPVVVAGRQRGCKKILVLYTNFGKHRKPEKTNWVMHQYHLGVAEEERDGELVVSKIFYQTQPRQCGVVEPAAAASAVPATAVERDDLAPAAPAPVAASSNVGVAFHGATGIEQFSFAQFRNSFEEVGVGASSSGQVLARADEGVHAGHHHHHSIHLEHDLRHQYTNQEQQRMAAAAAAAAAAFHISTPTDPISTLMTPPPGVHHASVVLRPPEPYGHAASYQQQQEEDELPHQPRKFDGRSTSGLEEVIMGCTSRRSKGGETSGGKGSTEWQYSSFWPSDNQDHHG